MNKEIEYYEFTYKIPKYKIKPPLNFSEYYQIHKDEIIIDLQQEKKQLQERIEYLERSNNRREDTILDQRQEISDLEDNWNKIKEYCADSLYFYDGYQREDLETDISIQGILNKMQELERGVSDVED